MKIENQTGTNKATFDEFIKKFVKERHKGDERKEIECGGNVHFD